MAEPPEGEVTLPSQAQGTSHPRAQAIPLTALGFNIPRLTEEMVGNQRLTTFS